MGLCMGMALSAPNDRPASGHKAGLVTRFRKKFNWHGAHAKGEDSSKRMRGKQSAVSEHSGRQQPNELPPKERRKSEGPGLSSRSLQPVVPSRAASLNGVPLREGINNGSGAASISTAFGGRESEPQITAVASVASDTGFSETDDGEDSRDSQLIPRTAEDEEMDWKWILNLSMHFRDQSDREKFFVTYAEQPNLRRRLTVSCDYRDAPEGTLERELSDMKFQRDKSAKIYEAIKDSLPAIQFYDTITNLKLQTSHGRLHVHVTEDVHEIIPYPPVIAIAHLRCPKYRESDLEFESHLSGFVYKVKVHGEVYIKKEIPGPDTVDEFLYEINALYALADSQHVIRFGGCVVDDRRERVKGLLISFASKGALIDILFHDKGHLPWRLREKWARQIISGLSEVHEAGYVQGDFTLSNIVIDDEDNAKIIDINRRGCPVGWEPPEVTAMINGLQRIGMYIGVKSDIFQLGMVLWGIAHELDEPEVHPRPLGMHMAPDDVPQYFRDIVDACLCDRPQGRPSAKDIVGLFPEYPDDYVPRLRGRHSGDDSPGSGSGSGNNGYIGEAIDGVVEVRLSGNGNGPGPKTNGNEYNGSKGLLLNAEGSPDSNSTLTHARPTRTFGSGEVEELKGGNMEGRTYPETEKIQTQGLVLDEELQVISASPSESAIGDEKPFPWPSLVGTVQDNPIPPENRPPDQHFPNNRESIEKGGEEMNLERLNRNSTDTPTPRPPMNGRAATRDSEVGTEKFSTARSSLDMRKSVAV